MKEGLEKLYTLQQLDDKLKELDNSLKTIPDNIKKLEDERDGKITMIENTKVKLKENVKEREKFEKDILLVKEKIKKYKEQMTKATTNKEYQGFTAEIKFEEDNITGIEEKIIEKMVEADEIMNEVRQSETEFKKVAEEYNKKIVDLKNTTEYNKLKIAETKKDRVSLRNEIPAKLLAIYDNNYVKRFGKAVSLVETEFCGICNVKLRPQRLNELLSSQNLLTCESCGRILYKKTEVLKEEDVEKMNRRKNAEDL
ncbi:MAG: zinc ribbon domain-containing protein [Candidatus Omnitrophota bacterium]